MRCACPNLGPRLSFSSSVFLWTISFGTFAFPDPIVLRSIPCLFRRIQQILQDFPLRHGFSPCETLWQTNFPPMPLFSSIYRWYVPFQTIQLLGVDHLWTPRSSMCGTSNTPSREMERQGKGPAGLRPPRGLSAKTGH